MQPREKFLNMPKNTRHVCVAHITLPGIRLNCVATAFFVARYCASQSCQARALNGNVYLKAPRNDTAIIVRNYMRRRQRTLNDRRIPADSGFFAYRLRGVGYLFLEAWLDDR